MRKTKWLALVAPLLAIALAASYTEVEVQAEVVPTPQGFALRIGAETVPLHAYEMPLCLAKGGPVKLSLKLEGIPPKVEEVVVREGPCPRGTELKDGVKARLSEMLRKGYLEAQGEIVRAENRWMLRIGETEMPLDPEALPPCLREPGVMVEVRANPEDPSKLTLAKDGCQAQVRVEAKATLRMTLKTTHEEMRGPQGEHPEMTMPEKAQEKMEEVKEKVKERANPKGE